MSVAHLAAQGRRHVASEEAHVDARTVCLALAVARSGADGQPGLQGMLGRQHGGQICRHARLRLHVGTQALPSCMQRTCGPAHAVQCRPATGCTSSHLGCKVDALCDVEAVVEARVVGARPHHHKLAGVVHHAHLRAAGQGVLGQFQSTTAVQQAGGGGVSERKPCSPATGGEAQCS